MPGRVLDLKAGLSGRLISDLERGPGNPLTAAVTARCRGALTAARGQLDVAVSELTAALRLHDQIDPQPIERGRTLLLLGTVQRRGQQRRAARAALAEAIGVFEDTGAAPWAARAHAELARLSGRAPGSGELTATELRVAELVCGGMSNKETAAELFVTVRAVDALPHPAGRPATDSLLTRWAVTVCGSPRLRRLIGRPCLRNVRYVAEFYLPVGRVKLGDLIRQARAAAEHSSGAGPAVRLLYAVHVPQDESCFAVYEAGSAEAVAAAGALAEIEFDWIVEATTARDATTGP